MLICVYELGIVKTDTASVLHEAMGYIRFLQEQVQVLSSPYLQFQQQHQTVSTAFSIFSETERQKHLHKEHIFSFLLFLSNSSRMVHMHPRQHSWTVI